MLTSSSELYTTSAILVALVSSSYRQINNTNKHKSENKYPRLAWSRRVMWCKHVLTLGLDRGVTDSLHLWKPWPWLIGIQANHLVFSNVCIPNSPSSRCNPAPKLGVVIGYATLPIPGNKPDINRAELDRIRTIEGIYIDPHTIFHLSDTLLGALSLFCKPSKALLIAVAASWKWVLVGFLPCPRLALFSSRDSSIFSMCSSSHLHASARFEASEAMGSTERSSRGGREAWKCNDKHPNGTQTGEVTRLVTISQLESQSVTSLSKTNAIGTAKYPKYQKYQGKLNRA